MTDEDASTPKLIPGLAGVPIAESSISYIDGQRGHLEYRGIDIETLAERSTFEECAYLLIYGQLPTRSQLAEFDNGLRHHRRIKYRIRDMIKCFPESAHPMDVLQACVAAMGMFYPIPRGLDSNVFDEEVVRWASLRLIAKMPTLVAAYARMRHGDDPIAPRDDLSHAANFLYMLTGEEPDELSERVMDVALIVHADHTMNASTFAMRVTASTLADPYTSISAAIGALSGPLHGGANEDVLKMLDAIESPDHVEPTIGRMMANKEKIPGLGHRIYKTKDPRATLLQRLYGQMAERYGADRTYEVASRIEALVADSLGAKGICPNVDFYSGIVYRKLGFDPSLFTPIFAMARVAGWLAHWREQLPHNRIFRPVQIYTGGHGLAYIPIDERG
ncbi:MAG TPA: citrate synthase [Mariprofundaceae bacterium]|nr:citrate synthase [Mariprofundaceae bacterium]